MMQDGELTFGNVVEGTFSTFARNAQPFGLYVAIVTFLGVAVEWGLPNLTGGITSFYGEEILTSLGLSVGIIGIVLFLAFIIAQYVLWQAVLRQERLGTNFADGRYLAFFGQSLLASLGIGFATVFLIIPGLIVAARWSMAPAFLIGNNDGVIDALGESWDTVSGNTTPIVLALLAGFVGTWLLSTGLVTSGLGYFGSLISTTMEHVVSNLSTVLMIAMGVYLFKALVSSSEQISEVFE
ncbi:MAG: hypothetical protein AAF687_11665 [Pseudomonadota bacterium]